MRGRIVLDRVGPVEHCPVARRKRLLDRLCDGVRAEIQRAVHLLVAQGVDGAKVGDVAREQECVAEQRRCCVRPLTLKRKESAADFRQDDLQKVVRQQCRSTR